MSLSALTQKPPAADAMTSKNPNIHFFILLPHYHVLMYVDLRTFEATTSLSYCAIHQITPPKRSKFIIKTDW
jgi:hypothetical protein